MDEYRDRRSAEKHHESDRKGGKVKTIRMFLAAAMILTALVSYGMVNKTIAVIHPGIGLGTIRLGDKLPDVIKKMDRKKPTDGKTVKSGNLKEYWLSYTDMGITFIFDEGELLVRIAISNPGIIVENSNIRVNSTVMELERTFGRGEIKNIDDRYEQRVFKNRGIGFTINKYSGKIEAIAIEEAK